MPYSDRFMAPSQSEDISCAYVASYYCSDNKDIEDILHCLSESPKSELRNTSWMDTNDTKMENIRNMKTTGRWPEVVLPRNSHQILISNGKSVIIQILTNHGYLIP